MTYIAGENRVTGIAPTINVSYQARRMPPLIASGFAYRKGGTWDYPLINEEYMAFRNAEMLGAL